MLFASFFIKKIKSDLHPPNKGWCCKAKNKFKSIVPVKHSLHITAIFNKIVIKKQDMYNNKITPTFKWCSNRHLFLFKVLGLIAPLIRGRCCNVEIKFKNVPLKEQSRPVLAIFSKITVSYTYALKRSCLANQIHNVYFRLITSNFVRMCQVFSI